MTTCKVWNHNRTIRKAVVAKNFKDFIKKGKSKLGFDDKDTVTAVLEVDGTEVQDDNYFSTLPNYTRFLLLRGSESWQDDSTASWRHQSDTVDVADGAVETSDAERLVTVMMMLRQDMTKLVTLDREELELVVSLDKSHIMESLRLPSREAVRMQSACQRYLDEQQDAQEAVELLRVLSKAQSHSSQSVDSNDTMVSTDTNSISHPAQNHTSHSDADTNDDTPSTKRKRTS